MDDFKGKRASIPGSLRVYRGWRLSTVYVPPPRVGLYAVSSSVCWDLTHKAKCHWIELDPYSHGDYGPLNIPDVECSCGIYGYYEFGYLYQGLGGYPGSAIVDVAQVVGTVRVSGNIIMGSKGVRAEFAEIESLCKLTENPSSEVLEIYSGIPYFESLNHWLTEFPPEDVSALISEDS